MSHPITFSVVVPTFQRPEQLGVCLAALARQDLPREGFEVIVVDDGGDGDLTTVVERFRTSVEVSLLRQPNRGPASGRNTAARRARNTFLAFTDDDCEPEPTWLSTLGRCLADRPDAAVGGRTVNGLPDNPFAATSQLIVDMVYACYNADPAAARFFATNNLSLPRERFLEIGGFDESFRTSEDRELCDRWRFQGWPLHYEPEARVVHRNHLTLATFWRQHVAYGAGAASFHRVRRSLGSSRLTEHGRFHLHVLRWWRRARQTSRPRQGTGRLLGLLALWQVANAYGFFSARLRRRKSRSPETTGSTTGPNWP